MIYRKGASVDFSEYGVYIAENPGAPDLTRLLTNSVGAIVGTACWGDATTVQTVSTIDELTEAYGTRQNGTIVKFVEAMFMAGTKSVKCYRVIGAGGVAATATKAAGSATTWDFAAKYKGTVGNAITYQILAGDITNTMTIEIVRGSKKYVCANVTNTSTDANYAITKFACPWVTLAKTGTATTLPTADANAVALTSGANGSAPSDADLVTGLVAFESDLSINRVAIAATASSTIRSGIVAHCDKMFNRIGFCEPVTQTTVATIVAELAGYNAYRVAQCVPKFGYYNQETGLYEDMGIAFMMGTVCAYAVHVSPAHKPINNTSLVTTFTSTEKPQLARAGAFYAGGVRSLNSNGVSSAMLLSSSLEYAKTSLYWGDIQVRSTFDLIESYLDVQYLTLVGFQGDLQSLKGRISGITTSTMETLKRMGVLYDYRFDVSGNTTTTIAAGEAYCKVWVSVYPAIKWVLIELGKMSDYSLSINEVVA